MSKQCEHEYVTELIECSHSDSFGPDYGHCLCIENIKKVCKKCRQSLTEFTPDGFEDKVLEYAKKLLESEK